MKSEFTVSNVWAMDEGLAEAMRRWNCYRKEGNEESAGGEDFANHCPHCGAAQEDYLLPSERGDVFFGLEMGPGGGGGVYGGGGGGWAEWGIWVSGVKG